MKPFRILIFVTLIAAGLPAQAIDTGDVQSWLDFNVQGSVADGVKLRMEQEMHFVDDSSDLSYHHADFGIQWSAAPHWDLGANYRQAYNEKNGNWERENRPHLNLTYKGKVRNLSFSNRSRLELRLRDNRSDIVRYRNKTTVTFPAEWTHLKLRPYLAEEFFIDSDQGSYNQNRAFAGLKASLHEHVQAAVYYMWQSVDKDTFWDDAHVFGLSLSLLL